MSDETRVLVVANVDEIIVSTFPGERSGWLRRDVVGRLRAGAGVPVQHVVVESEAGVPA